MKKLARYLTAAAFTLTVTSSALAADHLTTQQQQANMTPAQALTALKAGNQRFVSNTPRNYDYGKKAEISARDGQFPFAFVLNCVDSRSDAKLVFNQGIGNIFAGAVAGNVVDTYMLASMEFATKAAGSKLIVVMGHTHCGAVAAACGGKAFGHIDDLIAAIHPAVTKAKSQNPKGQCNDPTFVDQIAKQNVLDTIQYTLKHSPIIASLKQSGQIDIVGAMHDIATGQVIFFDINGKAL